MDLSQLNHSLESIKKFQPYEQAFSQYWYFMFFLNSTLFAITLFHILQSRISTNHEFRPVTIHATVTSWAMVSVLTLIQPVSLPPLFAGYDIGVAKVSFIGSFKEFVDKLPRLVIFGHLRQYIP